MSAEDRAIEVADQIIAVQDKACDKYEELCKKITVASANVKQLESAPERLFNVGLPIHNFVGRVAELEQFRNFIESGGMHSTCSQASCLSGLGGIGKTQLARKVAYEYFNTEDCNAVWIDAETGTGLTNSFHMIAEKMGVSIYDPKNPDSNQIRPLKDIVFDVYHLLAERRTLLVFDNANKYDDVRRLMPWFYFPNCVHFFALITSRNSFWDEEPTENIYPIQLQKFTKDEAVQYVKQGLKITSEDESIECDIDNLTKLMDYFPLGLSQAVAYIRYTQLTRDFGIKNYMDEYKKNRAALCGFHMKYDPYKMTILTTWQITFDAIKQNRSLGTRALELIYTMAFLAPNDILAEKFFRRDDENEEEFWDAFDLLEQYSITNTVCGVASVHRLVRDVLQLWLQQREETEIYLAKVLDITYLWNFNNLYYKEVATAHVLMFLEEACYFESITIDLFGKQKNISFLILQFLGESDSKAVVEKLFEHLKVGRSLLFPDYKTQTLRMAARFGSPSVVEYLEPGDLRWLFVARVFCAWYRGDYCQLRSFLLEIGDDVRRVIDSELGDMTTLAEIDITDFIGDEIRFRMEGVTALMFVASYGDLELMKILVEFGANVNYAMKDKETVLHRACENGQLEIVKYLVENGASMNVARLKFETPFYQAARHDHKEIVSFLLEAATIKNLASIGRENALCAAIMKKYLGVARIIVESGVDVNYSDILGRTPLHHAVSTGNLKLIELVTQRGAFINILDRKKKSPLYDAVERNHPLIVRWLLEHGAIIKVSEDDESDPLHLAAERGSLKILQIFSEKNVSCNTLNRYGQTPLHCAANFGRLDAVKKLVELGADVNICDSEGHLPMYYAVRGKKKKIVEFLERLLRSSSTDSSSLDKGE